MKKNKIAAAYRNSLNYKKGIHTMSIDGIVITGEEIRMAMNTNFFIGERIIAFNKDFSCFKENIARSLYLYDRKPELVGGYGLNICSEYDVMFNRYFIKCSTLKKLLKESN